MRESFSARQVFVTGGTGFMGRRLYLLLERLPATRESAQRLGLVTIEQMVGAMVAAIETPGRGVRILGVPEIRQASQQ